MIEEVMERKQTPTETYDAVLALYTTLRGTPGALRVKRAVYRQDEVQAEPLDFVLDVEIRSKQTAGLYYEMWHRMANSEQSELLPPWLKHNLGRVYTEYGLGEEGAYRKLYFKIKNEQMRSAMKGKLNGQGFPEPAAD